MAEENKNTVEETDEIIEEAAADEESTAEAVASASDDSAEDSGEAEIAEKKEGKIVDDILEIVESTLLTVFVVIMIFTYLLHPITVEGTSMNDTLFKNDRVFMSTVYFGPHYGDIIVINNDAAYLLDEKGEVVKKDITGSTYKECLIKRVIAEPGQTIDIDPEKEEVLIDGKVLDEPYIKDTINSLSFTAFDFPITIPEGYYFAMGDNRRVSADSRNPDIGLIKKDQIYGKAIIRYYPLKDFKFLTFRK